MIVGKGLLASAFDAYAVEALQATVFASGVSNSSETDPVAFARERALLVEHLARDPGTFVYFSTCSIEDPDRGNGQYARHKRDMEQVVAQRGGDYLVLRLPQVVGATANPHTLTNFIANHLRDGEPIPTWTGAVRCLVDVEHVAAITMSLLAGSRPLRLLATVAPPEVISMPALVDLMESITGLPARREVIEREGGTRPGADLMSRMGPDLGIDVSAGYTRRLLQKYYGQRNAD